MKDLEKIKHLRETLGIPLSDAKALLSEYEDIESCKTTFHLHNINVICRLTECDDTIANQYYNLFGFNVEKAIKKILALPNVLSIYPETKHPNRIGYLLYAENDDLEHYKTTQKEQISIHADDFDTVLPIFESVFPLQDPIYQQAFSPSNSHYFSNEVMRDIVNRLATLKTKDKETEAFLRQLIHWLNTKLRYANYIIVSGSL